MTLQEACESFYPIAVLLSACLNTGLELSG